MRPLTKTEFAKERHVSRARVYQWLGDGRIQALEDGRIDADDAHPRLDALLDQAKGLRREGNITSSAPELPGVTPDPVPGNSKTGRGGDKAYWDDKAREQKAVATLAEMRALQQAGALVAAAGVRKEAAELGRQLRNALLAIPDRISPVLDPGNPGRAHKLLTDELQRVLHELRVGLDERAAAAARADEREPALL